MVIMVHASIYGCFHDKHSIRDTLNVMKIYIDTDDKDDKDDENTNADDDDDDKIDEEKKDVDRNEGENKYKRRSWR